MLNILEKTNTVKFGIKGSSVNSLKINSVFPDAEGPTTVMNSLVDVSVILFISLGLAARTQLNNIEILKTDNIENKIDVS